MKTTIIFLIAALNVLAGCAQNGGQANENNVLKIEHISTTNGNSNILITNKQPCEVDVRISWLQYDTVIHIAGNTVVFAAVGTGTFTVKAKVESVCVSNPDRGWVELQTKNVLAINTNPRITTQHRANDVMLIGPSPCKDILMVKLKKGYAKPYHVMLINMLGIRKELLSNSEEFSIDMRTLWRGLYVIKVEDERGFVVACSKIVKL